MDRLTTDNPRDNLEVALNLFYAKDGETWVRGGGPGPEYKDVSLYDFTRNLIKAHIPSADVPEDDNELSAMMGEWLFDDVDSAEGTIAALYTAAWAYAELRNKLKAYEDTGLEPLETLRLKEGREGSDIYHEFARAAVDILGENLGEAINVALHLYANSTEFHSYDQEQQDLIPILAALDSAGLNSVLPEYDILRGGSFPKE